MTDCKYTIIATSTRLFKGRVVQDSDDKKGESLLASAPLVVLSTFLGKTPTMDEYLALVKGINLTTYAPPVNLIIVSDIKKGPNKVPFHFIIYF
jgi:aconitate hydratase 2/2-methylisocitrate dehydratase